VLVDVIWHKTLLCMETISLALGVTGRLLSGLANSVVLAILDIEGLGAKFSRQAHLQPSTKLSETSEMRNAALARVSRDLAAGTEIPRNCAISCMDRSSMWLS
jgi:hypothetical protein